MGSPACNFSLTSCQGERHREHAWRGQAWRSPEQGARRCSVHAMPGRPGRQQAALQTVLQHVAVTTLRHGAEHIGFAILPSRLLCSRAEWQRPSGVCSTARDPGPEHCSKADHHMLKACRTSQHPAQPGTQAHSRLVRSPAAAATGSRAGLFTETACWCCRWQSLHPTEALQPAQVEVEPSNCRKGNAAVAKRRQWQATPQSGAGLTSFKGL